ncbi:phosphotransferase enzyme family protein [Psychromonas sp. KJ10-10]|uniref:phosphotransferase enzyme family protein n=1 Tax=Psychromonas sp. KJ10-10 TaxID=3391823 RepID=UPI0039B36EC2
MLTLPVSYSATSPQALLDNILPQFQIEQAEHCVFWCQGLNDSYKVSTQNETFLLRIYRHQWRDIEAINFEIQALLYLQKMGADIAYPIATHTGDHIVQITAPEGIRYAILTRYAKGQELTLTEQKSAEVYAQHMTQIHLLSEQFKPTYKRFKLDVKHLITEPLQRIKPFLADRLEDWEFIKNGAKALTLTLQSMLDESSDIGFCHGDMHGGNAHYDGSQLISFDFDCCAIGLRVYDLAIFKWALKLNKKDDAIWVRFLKTYQQHRPLNKQDIKQIDNLVAVRQIWLMGLHIDIAVAKGWLNDAYFDRQMAFLRENIPH